MTTTEVILGVLAAVLATLLVFVYFSGEHRIEAQQAVAAQKAIDAAADQKRQDNELSQNITADLRSELAVATALAARPAAPVRLCNSPGSVRANPASSTPRPDSGGTAPPVRSVPEVPDGAGSGTDMGASLQRFTAAAEALGAYARACRQWGLLQDK